MRRIVAILCFTCLTVFSACQSKTTEKPIIISTIKPIQALVYAVAGGADSSFELHQLLPDGVSPHHYALKPSDSRLLSQAKVVFQIDKGLETFMDKLAQTLPAQTKLISLAHAKNVQLLPLRTKHEHEDETAEEHAQHDAQMETTSTDMDWHIWLDPANAIAMTEAIADTLSQLDSANASRYHANAAHLNQQIQATDQRLIQQLQAAQHKPYLTFHDAWQYFDKHYALQFAGAVTLDASRQPGTRHVVEIRQLITQKQAVCLFQEPQFPPALVKTLVENSSITVGELDPLGANLPLDNYTYSHLLEQAADSFDNCLVKGLGIKH